jgi:hypothetical protein
VVGAIIYTGLDAAARQTSTIFGGSALVHQLLNDNPVDVRKLLDRITTYIKLSQHFAPHILIIDIAKVGGIAATG